MATPERVLAHEVLVRLDTGDRWVAVEIDAAIAAADLDDRERRQATDLVYGVTRGRRRLDHVAARHLDRDPDAGVRAALRIGTYQLFESGIDPHAAVSQAVALVPRRARGFVNAVLRRIADAGDVPADLPGVVLSYPDWIVSRLDADLGEVDSRAALAAMNMPVTTPDRGDGYRQDPASAWVVDLVGAQPGERVGDLCAAPGGKATGLASTGAMVIAGDVGRRRGRTLAETADRFGSGRVAVVLADAARPALRPHSLDRVLLDAPCSGLGALRRRADARWRIDSEAVGRLAALQTDLLDAAVDLAVDGGRIVYSVCTLTTAETTDVVDAVLARRPELIPLTPEAGDRWRHRGSGVIVLPHDHGTDGMFATVFEVDRTNTRGGR